MVNIVATIKKIKYVNEVTGFGFFQFAAEDGSVFSGRGAFGPLYAGYRLNMVGNWVVNDRGAGLILDVEYFDIAEPDTLEGFFLLLTSGLYAGMTKAIARHLINIYGSKTLEVLKADINVLSTVPGVGIKTFIKIRNSALSSIPQQERVVQVKTEYGFTMSESLLIVREFPENTMVLLQKKPYSMYMKLDKIPFARFDQVIQAKGWPNIDPQRIREAIHALMRSSYKDGNTIILRKNLIRDATAYLSIDEYLVLQELDYLLQKRRLHASEYKGSQVLQTQWIYGAEKEIATRLRKIVQTPPEKQLVFDDTSPLLEKLKTHQALAVAAPFFHKLSICTGRPGAGKTTLLRTVLNLLDTQNTSYVAVSPTGKAAQRLREVTRKECMTIHRLLGAMHDSDDFKHNDTNPLQYDVFLVDETSMLDTLLFRSLLRAIPYTSRLVLIGDVDQLASVGVGAIYRDLIASSRVPTYWLTQVLRITKENGELPTPLIVANGIREGTFVCPDNDEEWEYHATTSNKETEAVITNVLNHLIAQGVTAEDVQVFAPTNEGELGVGALNTIVKRCFVPHGLPVIEQGDKVMQAENDYELQVFNGDIGVVKELYPDYDLAAAKDPVMLVDMSGRLVEFSKQDMYNLSLAYATSGHKSQGSEYPYVIIAIPETHVALMDRHWFYTVVTRCQKKVFVIGNDVVVRRTVSSRKSACRHTMLPLHLEHFMPPLLPMTPQETQYQHRVMNGAAA